MVEVFLMLMGLAGIGLGGRGVLARRLQTQRPQVRGRIVSLEVVEDARGGGGVARFEPRPRYAYTVDGVAFEGSRLTPTPVYMSEAGAWTVLRDLPAEPNVYYDPEAPMASWLAADPALLSWFTLAAGLTMLLLGVGESLGG